MGDAIIRTLYRLFISHRNLLEWVPAAQAGAGRSLNLSGFYRQMAAAPLIGALAILVALASGQGTWPLAMVFALLWTVSPAIALRVSFANRDSGKLAISQDDTLALRITARRTWRFFESFVTDTDNLLPPDNFQETPVPVARPPHLAHQYRALSPLRGQRAGLRLDRADGSYRTA